jgi:hypothetical protein
MTLSITTCLTLVSMSNGVFTNSPRTSYLKAVDIWLLGSFSFAFVVLINFCHIIYCNWRKTGNEVLNSLC